MRGTLPDEILDRRKQGFGTPMPEWLRGRFGELAERTVSRQRSASVGYSTWIRLFACSPPTEQVAETGATTCGISTASAHGTTGGSRGGPPDGARRRAACDVCGRVRWLHATARDNDATTPTTSDAHRRRRRPVRAPARPSAQQARVVRHEERARLRADRSCRACSPPTRCGTAPTWLSSRSAISASPRSSPRRPRARSSRASDRGSRRTTDSTPVYVVGPDQRCVPVHLDVTQAYGKTLSKAFERVPLPADAHPAAGSDAHLTLIQPSTDSMWEFWKLRRDGDRVARCLGRRHPRRLVQPGLLHRGFLARRALRTGARPPRACRSSRAR